MWAARDERRGRSGAARGRIGSDTSTSSASDSPSAADVALHAPKPGDASTARITIVRDGLTREIGFGADDESILAAATRAGLDVPYSCKSASVHLRAKLVEGRVGAWTRTSRSSRRSAGRGFVLTCQIASADEKSDGFLDER